MCGSYTALPSICLMVTTWLPYAQQRNHMVGCFTSIISKGGKEPCGHTGHDVSILQQRNHMFRTAWRQEQVEGPSKLQSDKHFGSGCTVVETGGGKIQEFEDNSPVQKILL